MVASITAEELVRKLTRSVPPVVLDVRREPAFPESPHVLPGSVWRRPDSIPLWCGELPAERTIVVCCVRGREVSQGVAAVPTAAELDVKYLEGGIEGWAVAGLPLSGTAAGVSP